MLARRRWRYDDNGRVQRIADERWGTTRVRVRLPRPARRGEARASSARCSTTTRPARCATSSASSPTSDRAHPVWDDRPGNLLVETPERRATRTTHAGRRVTRSPHRGEGKTREESRTLPAGTAATGCARCALPDGRTRALHLRRLRPAGAQGDDAGRAAGHRGDGRARAREGPDALPQMPGGRVPVGRQRAGGRAGPGDRARGSSSTSRGRSCRMLQQEQGAVFTYVNDHLGMPKELVDQDGRVAWAAAHSAWGRVVEVSGTRRRSGRSRARSGCSGSTTTRRRGCATRGSGISMRRSGGG